MEMEEETENFNPLGVANITQEYASKDKKLKRMPIFVSEQHEQNLIQNLILNIRGYFVIMDRDLAMLYGVKTIALNQAVKRNERRFPERFRFQLTENEKNELITFCDRFHSLKHSTTLPYAFTEQGVTQLSAILHSDIAIDMSIRICDAFVAMSRFLTQNAGIFQRIENLEREQLTTNSQIQHVIKRMNALAPTIAAQQLFATGCIWDAYTYMANLIRSAKQQVILIDNYCNDKTLNLLDQRGVDVPCNIHTTFNKIFDDALEKHNKQYSPINKMQLSLKIHDRFLIIDQQVFLLGNSLKDIGHTLSAVIKTSFTPEEILSKLGRES